MCTGEGCPFKENCYRFKAKASEYQSYFVSPPIENGKCRHYWEIEKPEPQFDFEFVADDLKKAEEM